MKQLLLIFSMLLLFWGSAIAQPTITNVSPSRNAIDVSVNSNIVITFSEDMNALGLIQPDAVTIEGSQGGKYSNVKTVSGFNDVLTVNPDSSFIPGEIITVFISALLNDGQTSSVERFSYQFRVETNGSGVGYFSTSDTFTGSIGDNGANMTYLADIDADGDQDAIVVTRTASDLKFYVLYKQSGDSYLTPNLSRTYDIANGSNPQGATFNDIDNDGDLDFILFVNPGSNTRSFYVYTNNGFGSFTSHSSSFHSDLPTTSIGGGVFSDVDRDGLDELFMLADNVYGLWPFENNGGGTPASFLEGSSVGSYGSIAGRLAISRDFNNDDWPDFAIIKKINFSSSATNDSLGILLSNGSGGFTETTYNVGKVGASFKGAWGMDAGDFDGDGYVDLAIVTNDSLYVLDNNQDGTFAAQRSFNKNFAGGDFKAADMDSDGDLDVVILGSYTSIIYNDGSGDFGNPFGFSRGYSGIVPALGDADGDGDLDVVYSVNGTMTVLRNGTISAPSSSSSISSFTNNYGTSVQVNWSGGNGAKTLLIAKEGSAVDASPVDDTEYTASATFGSGSEITSGNFVVYSGNSSNATVTGLNPDSTYYFKAIEFNNAGAAFAYRTSVSTGSVTANKYPTTASTISLDLDQGTKLDISWSGGNGAKQLVAIREGSAITWIPDDSTTYAADSAFGAATDLGDGTKIISDGNSGSVTVTGLSLSTTYYFTVFDYNGNAGFENYLTSSTGTTNTTTQNFEGQAFDSTAGYAYKFDGGVNTDSNGEIFTDVVIIDDQFTTELWIKPDSLGIQQYFLSWYQEQLVLGINSSNQLFGFHTQQGTGGSQVTVTGTTTLSKDVWYHVALTGETGGNLTLYVNGVEEASSAITDVSGDDDYDDYWYIGSESAGNNNFYGTVDELRIWSAVRTESEIRSFMHRPYSGLVDDLGAYWQFNEGTGDSDDELNGYTADFSDEGGWITSTAPVASGTVSNTNNALTGTLSLGNVSLQLTDAFDNNVDVYAYELDSPLSYPFGTSYQPSGYNSTFGNKYFIVNVFGDPGTFSANLTLNYGVGNIPSGYDSTPDSLTLFTRGSNTDSTWASLGGADAVSSASGTATWNGLTTFSQFAAVDTGNVEPEAMTFTKTNFADASLEANQDRIAYDIWITRGDDGKLYNAYSESSVSSGVSPAGTQWAYGTTADGVESLTFDDFDDLVSSEAKNLPGKSLVMYLYEHDEYIDVRFDSWTNGSSNGGGFSYTRTTVNIPDPEPIDFDTVAGYALEFDGTDDYIYYSTYSAIIDDYDDMPDPVTFEMWVNVDSLTDGKMVLTASRGTTFQIGIDSTDHFYGTFRNTSLGDNRATSTTTVVEDQWYHLAISVESNNFVKLYVNGTIEDSTSMTTMRTSADDYYFGKSRFLESSGYHYFDGKMDEVRIWQEARTDSAIRAGMFSSNLNATKLEILSYWQMNEGSGTTVEDLANGQDLDLVQDGAGFQPAWVTSDVPIGGGTPQITNNFQNGSVTVGKASLNMAEGFDNPVDIQVTEVDNQPNVLPSGFTSGLGNKYFVINLFGDPGTFNASLTLNYGGGVLNSTTLSEYKLFKRGSNSTGAWTEVASAATSVNTTSGEVTWSGITSFSQFIGAIAEPSFSLSNESQVFNMTESGVFSFSFSITGDFDDSTMVLSTNTTTSGTLFIDQNDNNSYDDGTDSLLTSGKEIDYIPSSNDLLYAPISKGVETFNLKLTYDSTPDSITVTMYTIEQDHQLLGNGGENGWYLLSNPFTTTIGELLSTVWTQGAVNSNAPSGSATLYTFSQDSSKYVAVTTDIDTTKLSAGTGLLAYIYEDDDPTDGDIDGGWPKTLTNYGNPFGTDVDITIKNVDHDGVSGTSGSEGFALLGNPYGWPLSADSVIATIKREDALANSYVYRWDPVNKTYKILATGAIDAYESFFVRVVTSGTTANLSFDYNDADIESPAKRVAENPFEFTLVHSESGLESNTYLRFDEKAGEGIDPFDGYYLGSYANSYANFYTQIGDQNLSINNLPTDLNEIVEFPMYLDATVSGVFGLEWNSDQLPKDWEFSLEEVSTGTIFDLKKQEQFNFSHGVSAKVKAKNSIDEADKEEVVSDAETAKASLEEIENEAPTGEELLGSKSIESTINTPDSKLVMSTQSKAKSATLDPIFVLTINPLLGIGTEDVLGVPREVELDQNYPNPFNPTSVIRFGVPNTAKVQLEVFDILGRKVATLLNNETKQPGRYNVQFDARNLASGMYIYRLVIGDNILTKKMTLIK